MKKLMLFVVIILISVNIYSTENQFMFSGTGDDIISITKEDKNIPYVANIDGNKDKRFFSVKSYDSGGNYIDLLVNTGEIYYGCVPLDLPIGTITTMLEIKAEGKWQIIVLPISMTEHIDIGVKRSYPCDNVLWINGEAKTAKIIGNYGSNFFSVIAYDKYGNYSKLLVNTDDIYSGTVLLPKDTLLLKVSATGNWSILLK